MSDIPESLEVAVMPRHYKIVAERLRRNITPEDLIAELNEFASTCFVEPYRGGSRTGKRKLIPIETPILAEATSYEETGGIFIVQRYGGNEKTYRSTFLMLRTPEPPSELAEQREIRWSYRDG